jgi:hypothetical protein
VCVCACCLCGGGGEGEGGYYRTWRCARCAPPRTSHPRILLKLTIVFCTRTPRTLLRTVISFAHLAHSRTPLSRPHTSLTLAHHACPRTAGIRVISVLGAGAKADPTRVFIADMADALKDPLAHKLRRELRYRADGQVHGSRVGDGNNRAEQRNEVKVVCVKKDTFFFGQQDFTFFRLFYFFVQRA